jgi:hypothetical protein
LLGYKVGERLRIEYLEKLEEKDESNEKQKEVSIDDHLSSNFDER